MDVEQPNNTAQKEAAGVTDGEPSPSEEAVLHSSVAPKSDITANSGKGVAEAVEVEELDLPDEAHGEKTDDWREAPIRHVLGIAEDPLEAILLDSLIDLKRSFNEYTRMGDRVRDLAVRQRYLDCAMKISSHMLQISEHIRKYRHHGRQEVVVHHQTDSVLRTPRARSCGGRRNADRAGGKTEMGGAA